MEQQKRLGKDKNIHSGHRQRIRDRFLKTGLDGFQDHEVLELLLFYAIPRGDTNKIAHQLLERFGSFSGVCDAPIEELQKDGTIDSITSNYIGDEAGKHPYETPDGTEYPNGTLTMATNAQFDPYEYYDGDQIVGIDADIAKAICDKLGYELKIEDMEFDAIIAAVSSGKADFGAAGITVTEDRKKNIDFTDTYTKACQVIVVRNK